jgi:dipeptidyl aminopeptidase/acylaminoacyl peptidase
LAFHASGGESDPNSGAVLRAVVIIDLAANSAEVLHEYDSFGQRGGPEIAWSPDGEWLAVVNPGEIDPSGDPMAMWLLKVTNGDEIFLGFSSNPIWSPEGDYLIYVAWPPIGTEALHQVEYVEAGVWQPVTVTELGDAYPESWIVLP